MLSTDLELAVRPSRPRSILTAEQVIEIFEYKKTRCSSVQYISGKETIALAKKYAVSEKAIRDIWTGRTWVQETAHLDASRPAPIERSSRRPGRPKGSKVVKSQSMKHLQRLASGKIVSSDCSADQSECKANILVNCSMTSSASTTPEGFGIFANTSRQDFQSCDVMPNIDDDLFYRVQGISTQSVTVVPKPAGQRIPYDVPCCKRQYCFESDFVLQQGNLAFQGAQGPVWTATNMDDPFHDDWAFWLPDPVV